MQPDKRNRRPEDSWHLDKRVPLALILTLLVQFTVFVYGYAQLSSQVKYNAASITAINTVVPRLVRVETLMEGVNNTLTDIKNDLRSTTAELRIRNNDFTKRNLK